MKCCCLIEVSDSYANWSEDVANTDAVNLILELSNNASSETVDLVEANLTAVNEVLTEVE